MDYPWNHDKDVVKKQKSLTKRKAIERIQDIEIA